MLNSAYHYIFKGSTYVTQILPNQHILHIVMPHRKTVIEVQKEYVIIQISPLHSNQNNCL